MNNTMQYRNYRARIEYSTDDECFVGHIAGITDVIGFHGLSVDALRQAFHEAVDDYLTLCDKVGKKPQKSASGKILLRLPPELHARAARAAEASGKSVNKWIVETIARAGAG
ncbi:MAG: type II toxin-antitoxin system HicB family antitoxin [Mariprofundales bacterium]